MTGEIEQMIGFSKKAEIQTKKQFEESIGYENLNKKYEDDEGSVFFYRTYANEKSL